MYVHIYHTVVSPALGWSCSSNASSSLITRSCCVWFLVWSVMHMGELVLMYYIGRWGEKTPSRSSLTSLSNSPATRYEPWRVCCAAAHQYWGCKSVLKAIPCGPIFALWSKICSLHCSANAALLHAKWLEFLSTRKSPSEYYTEYSIRISPLTPRLSGSPPKVRLRRSVARSCRPSLCSPVFHSTTTFTKHLPRNPTSLLRRLPKLASVSTQVTRSSNERTSLR